MGIVLSCCRDEEDVHQADWTPQQPPKGKTRCYGSDCFLNISTRMDGAQICYECKATITRGVGSFIYKCNYCGTQKCVDCIGNNGGFHHRSLPVPGPPSPPVSVSPPQLWPGTKEKPMKKGDRPIYSRSCSTTSSNGTTIHRNVLPKEVRLQDSALSLGGPWYPPNNFPRVPRR